MFAKLYIADRHMDVTDQKRTTVLVVDDDDSVRSLIVDTLRAEGHVVVEASTGAAAEAAMPKHQPNLVVLDILLPDTDGLLLCPQLLANYETHILMLSASTRDSDRVLSLRLGADDYMTKPFNAAELAARVEAILRRDQRTGWAGSGRFAMEPAAPARQTVSSLPPHSDATIRLSDLSILQRRRTVTVDGQRVPLTPAEYRLLLVLARQPDRVVGRDELAYELWGRESVGDSRAIDVYVRRIRAKLEPFGHQAPRIITMRGFGYMLTALS